MARQVYRLPPCPAYDVEGMESWLTDMASRGLHLCRDGFFTGIATFTKGSPCHMKYRLEAAPKSTSMWSKDGGEPDAEAVDISKEYGWEYVAARGNYYIYRSSQPGTRELNTDPEVQAMALNAVGKRERAAVVLSLFWALVYPLFSIRGNLFLTMINAGTWFVLYGFALLVWGFSRSLVRAIHLSRLRKKLLNQGGIDHQKDWRRKAARYRIANVLLGVLIAVWIGILLHNWSFSVMERDTTALADYAGNPPFATIADFTAQGEYSIDSRHGLANTVRVWKDWLAPLAMDWEEIATVKLPDGTALSGNLYVDYYETVSPWLANAVAQEHLRTARRGKDYEEIQLPNLGVDYAVAYWDWLHFPTLVVQHDNKVLRASFYQPSYSSHELTFDQWIGIMVDSIK